MIINGTDAIRAKAWCPYCGAIIGERCKSGDRTPRYVHLERKRLADRL